MHPFRPTCLRSELERHLDQHGVVDHGVVVHTLAGLVHDVDHSTCPRCQGPARRLAGEVLAGSRVTACRCIPICRECEAREANEASVGLVYSVFDWYQDRSVREDVERDLAELDSTQPSFVADMPSIDDRGRPVV